MVGEDRPVAVAAGEVSLAERQERPVSGLAARVSQGGDTKVLQRSVKGESVVF